MDNTNNSSSTTAPAEETSSISLTDNKGITLSSPFINHPDTVRSIMADVLIATAPSVVWGIYAFGARAAVIIISSILFSVAFEAAYELLFHRRITISDCSAAVTGLLFSLTLPVSAPLWVVPLGTFFAIVVSKQLFGGLGRNIINPALAARVFLSIIAPASMRVYPKPHQHLPAFSINVSAKVAKSPLAALAAGELPEESVYSMLVGEVAGAIGGVSALLLAAGFIYMLIRRTVSWHIPVTYLATVAVIALSFPKNESSVLFTEYEILSGGLVLIAIFMATDVVTTPLTSIGKIIVGAGCGALTMLLRYYGAYEEGAACAVLIMNLLVYIIDRLTMPSIFGGKKGAHWRE